MKIFSSSKIVGATLAGALLAIAPVGASADGMIAGGQTNNAKANAAGKAAAPAFVYMMVPVEVANKDNSMRSGCWAKIYSMNNYGGDSLTLTGPMSIADMDGPYGMDWDDKVDSIELGPKATLTVYDNEGFRDVVGQFKPGQRVNDISKALGFFDEFASVRLTCAR